MNKEMGEEVQNMCNLSMGVFYKGEMKKAKETAYKLQDMGLSVEKIAYAVEVSTETVQEWIEERDGIPVK